MFKSKMEAQSVNAGHYMAFTHTFHLLPIWLQTLVAIYSESYQTQYPRICAPPSEVAVLLDSNLSRRHFLGQVAFHLLPIGLQTLVVIDSESRLTSFPCFFTPPSEVSALFNSNLSRHPFLRQVVNLDLLLCRIRFGTCDFAPMSYFYSETNDSSQD